MSEYRTKKPGDILRLPLYLGDIPAAGYVLLSVGDRCSLALAGEDAAGNLCATNRLIEIELADLYWFVETGVRVNTLG